MHVKPHEYKFVEPHELEELTNAINALVTVNEESIPAWESTGRVLSRDIVTPMDIPPHAKAAYDGYAVRSQDVSKVPTKLRLVGSVHIGEVPSIRISSMETVYVTTGTYLPEGADAVVPEEFVDIINNNEVIINRAVKPWGNVDPAGSFARKGEVVLREGTVIMPWDTPALLELGIGEVWVRRKIRIFMVATGSELVEAKAPSEVIDAVINGKVVESTASFIRDYVRMYIPYAEVVGRTIVPDDQEAIRNAITKALDMADVVMTTGGTGPSGVDYVYEVTRSLNPRIYIRGLRMRPGRPTGLAVLSNNKVIINLSGHPISALNAMTVVAKGVIKRLAGVKVDIAEPRVMGKLVRGTLGDNETARQYRVRVRKVNNEYVIEELPRQGSSLTHTLLMINGLVFTRRGQIIREGDYADVLLLREPLRD